MTPRLNLTVLAREVGFTAAGWAESNSPEAFSGYAAWIEAGKQGPLDYLARHADLRQRPQQLLENGGVGFVVVVMALPFAPGDSRQLEPGRGWIARYARGRDYHKVMRRRLTHLLELLRSRVGPAELEGRALVDSAPVLERDLAVQAGLGWIGKNGLLLHPQLGSSLLIGSLLLSHRLEGVGDPQLMNDHCGRCTKCLEVCPTQCLDVTTGLDAARCISTWTIEDDARPAPADLAAWGSHLFGCDLCQDVCPWNRFAMVEDTSHPLEFREDLQSPELVTFLTRLLESPADLLNGTALKRAGRLNLLRNALVVAHVQKFKLPASLLEAWRRDNSEAAELIDWASALPEVG